MYEKEFLPKLNKMKSGWAQGISNVSLELIANSGIVNLSDGRNMSESAMQI